MCFEIHSISISYWLWRDAWCVMLYVWYWMCHARLVIFHRALSLSISLSISIYLLSFFFTPFTSYLWSKEYQEQQLYKVQYRIDHYCYCNITKTYFWHQFLYLFRVHQFYFRRQYNRFFAIQFNYEDKIFYKRSTNSSSFCALQWLSLPLPLPFYETMVGILANRRILTLFL